LKSVAIYGANSVTNTPTEPSLEGQKMRQEFEAWAHDVRGESDVSELEPAGWTVWQAAYAAGCAAERERCAKYVEEEIDRQAGFGMTQRVLRGVASAIRGKHEANDHMINGPVGIME
jgi:hypothetical protein